MKRSVDKLLLFNHIRHTDTHNRVHEENDMWRLRKLEKMCEDSLSDVGRTRHCQPLVRGRLVSDEFASTSLTDGNEREERMMMREGVRVMVEDGDEGGRRRRRKRREFEDGREHHCKSDDEGCEDYYWTRQLMKAEENDPFRWGHSGYKDLHPEEFESDDGKKDKKTEGRGEFHKKKKKKSKKHHERRKEKRRQVADESHSPPSTSGRSVKRRSRVE